LLSEKTSPCKPQAQQDITSMGTETKSGDEDNRLTTTVQVLKSIYITQ
jgi:hypothetical protein